MTTPYSKRTADPPDIFRFDIPLPARNRILHAIDQLGATSLDSFRVADILPDVKQALLVEYGQLESTPSTSEYPLVISHFFSCSDEKALDFIEFVFRSRAYRGHNTGVDRVNTILQDEGIGYEFTQFVEVHTGRRDAIMGSLMAEVIETQYPQAIRKDTAFCHQQILQPCLQLLTTPQLQTANKELLAALAHYRKGNYATAITASGSAFESLLKTICVHKRFQYDPNKDTCARLVQICGDAGLFPPYYVSVLQTPATLRNKLGDAHGKGPGPTEKPNKEHADHMINLTAANIIFLATLAGF